MQFKKQIAFPCLSLVNLLSFLPFPHFLEANVAMLFIQDPGRASSQGIPKEQVARKRGAASPGNKILVRWIKLNVVFRQLSWGFKWLLAMKRKLMLTKRPWKYTQDRGRQWLKDLSSMSSPIECVRSASHVRWEPSQTVVWISPKSPYKWYKA